MLFARAVTFVVAVVAVVGADEPITERKCDKNILWTGGTFEWPCVATKSIFKNSGRYISKNILATRVAIYKDDAILALPRYKPGVPATLARVSLKDKNCQASLWAFPCWSLQEEGTCSALQNVVDLFLDPQEVLWVLDTGVINSLEQPERKCPPKVVALNIKTGKVLKTVDLSGLTNSASRLQYVVADYNPDGRVFVYVSDAASRAILVYDVTSGRGYRVVLPQAVTLNCDRRDVLYLALVRHNDGSTCLLFTYLGSSRVFSIRTDHLRSGNAQGRIQDLGVKPQKIVILGTDNGSAVFFRYVGNGEVYRWDSITPFVAANFQPVYENSYEGSLPTHIVPDYRRGQMRVLESNFPDYMQGTVGCGANHALILMHTIFVTILSLLYVRMRAGTLETIAQWSLLEFALPNERGFQYQPENIVMTGIEITWNRIFVSTPRLRSGVPATLSFFPRNVPLGSNPKLQAYPSWDWHGAGKGEINCTRLISVYRTRLDRCDRLWVVDAGVMTSIDDFMPVCPPKVVVFDLKTDQVIRHVTFPREVLRPDSLLTNVVVDEVSAKTCDDVFLYMTDTLGPGILIFDGATDRSWRVIHSSMFPNPDQAMYTIGSDTFEFLDGVVGLTFSPKLGIVYYQPLATDRIFSVPTSALQAGPLPFGEQLPVTLVGRKSSQGLALAVDPRDDTIIFSPFTETAIASWQPQTNQQRILAYSPEKLQFTADILLAKYDNGNIWIMSSRFHKFFLRRIDNRQINIRIMRLKADNQALVPTLFNQQIDPYLQFYNNTLGF
ncbi:YELL protein, partial [Acromyrmex insinuator]